MGVKRFPNWPARLLEAIAEKANTRFSPGEHDCCISACDIIERMTGTDIAANFRHYHTKKEMLSTLEEHGGVKAIAERVMREYDCEEIGISLAGRGDMALLDIIGGDTLGIVDMDGIHAVAPGAKGWEHVPIKVNASRAWRIG